VARVTTPDRARTQARDASAGRRDGTRGNTPSVFRTRLKAHILCVAYFNINGCYYVLLRTCAIHR